MDVIRKSIIQHDRTVLNIVGCEFLPNNRAKLLLAE